MTTVAATSLYLSRLLLNPRSRQVMSEIAHPYEMHRTLMRAFPRAAGGAEARARGEYGVLFRADVDDAREIIKVYVQSRVEPDWSALDELPNYLCTDARMPSYEHKDMMPACRSIENGQVFRFRLRANPARRVGKDEDRLKGKRVELSREEEQIAWLIHKGERRAAGVPGGFALLLNRVKGAGVEEQRVPCVSVSCEGKMTGCKQDGTGRHVTTHLAVLFDGLLRVTDSGAFLESLVRGIGPGKAFGFGLLSVAKS